MTVVRLNVILFQVLEYFFKRPWFTQWTVVKELFNTTTGHTVIELGSFMMALCATVPIKNIKMVKMSKLPLSLLKNSIQKHSITRRFHYSRPFEIFKSMGEIFYPSEGIKFRNWRRPSGKCALASHEFINIYITEKCCYIMWNQQPFNSLFYGYNWLKFQQCLLFSWKFHQYQHFYLWVGPERCYLSVNTVLIKDCYTIFE